MSHQKHTRLWATYQKVAWMGLLVALMLPMPSMATLVSLRGISGQKALVAVDNRQPRFLAINEEVYGVTLIKLTEKTAVFKTAAETFSLPVGATWLSKGFSTVHPEIAKKMADPHTATANLANIKTAEQLSNTPVQVPIKPLIKPLINSPIKPTMDGQPTKWVITKDAAGSYITDGLVNNQPVRFLVDTGASYISMSIDEAIRLGINYEKGVQGNSKTAGGVVKHYTVKLDSVVVGPFEMKDITASVMMGNHLSNFMLLGMNFLSHFRMLQDNGKIELEANSKIKTTIP